MSIMNDEFPIGMRVLAVDDNAVYLKTLETLLRECKFQVTTANEGTTALKLLRENKNEFDLVISDVKMPGMDGFDLLKIVRLEMDLPVIMLSKYGDKELIMKGITHGACDYLVKPVQVHVLKNIWQHVFRKKLRSTERINSDKARGESGEVREELKGTGNVDHDSKSDNKRKNQNCEEHEDSDKKGQDLDDPSSQKKARVVWAGELHQKFVAAVNTLGVDQAVPKRILELMNDEKITRENVASHLQKYRHRLKRSSSVGSNERNSWQVDNTRNMNCARNTPHPAVRNSNSLPGLGSCSRLFQSSGVAQWGQRDNSVNRIQHEPNFHNSSIHSMPYGTPMPPTFDSREQKKDLKEKSAARFGSSHYTICDDPSTFNVNRARNCGFASNNAFFGNSCSNAAPSLSSDSLSMLPNFGGSRENWPTAIQRTRLCYEQSLSIGSRDHIPMLPANVGISSHEVSSCTSVVNAIPDIRTHSQCNMNQNLIQVERILNQECFNQSSHTIGPENALVVPPQNNNEFSGFHMDNEDLGFLRETDLDDMTMEQFDSGAETDNDLRLEKPTMKYEYNS